MKNNEIKILFIIIVVLNIVSCKKKESSPKESSPYESKRDTVLPTQNEKIIKKLNSAFSADDSELFDEFMNAWYNECHPADTSQFRDSIQIDLYKIGNRFYNPWTFARIFPETYVDKSNFIVLPDKLPYAVIENIDIVNFAFFDTLSAYRPVMPEAMQKYVYMNQNYFEAIFKFIQLDKQPLPNYITDTTIFYTIDTTLTFRTDTSGINIITDTLNIAEISETTEISENTETTEIGGVLYSFTTDTHDEYIIDTLDIEQRIDTTDVLVVIDTIDIIYPYPDEELINLWNTRKSYLNKFMNIDVEKKGNFWTFVVMPQIIGISIDEKRKNAIVRYKLFQKHGIAKYVKTQNNWDLLWFRPEWE